MTKAGFIPLVACLFAPAPVGADIPQVLSARATNTNGSWNVEVTLKHADTGWDHYADGGWVLGDTGQILADRVLAHPHVNEQPFTRSLRGIDIPEGTQKITIRPHDLEHGDGPDFELILE